MLTDYPVAASAGAEMRPEWARSRMYEAFLDLLRRLAADGPVVLAIEDLHWADDSTRELLAFLVRNAQAERLLLLVTFRSDESRAATPAVLARRDRPATRRRADRAATARPRRRCPPAQLDPGAFGGLGLIASVYERSEGNPFFAEELIAAGVEGRGLPPTLREVLQARLAHVSEPTLRLLVAAVVGRKVDHDLLAQLSEMHERELYDALEEAVAAQLLVVDETVVIERYEFRHALTAEAAAEAVLPNQRRRLHVTIAEHLEKAPAPGRHGGAEAPATWRRSRTTGSRPANCRAPSIPRSGRARPPPAPGHSSRRSASTSARSSCGTSCRRPRRSPHRPDRAPPANRAGGPAVRRVHAGGGAPA